MSNLKIRTLTGVLIVVFVLGGFLLHPLSFLITSAVLLTGSQFEYLKLAEMTGARPGKKLTLAAGIFLYLLSVAVATSVLEFKWLLLSFIPVAAILITELFRKEERPFDSLAHSIFSLVYIALPFSLFPFSAFNSHGIDPLYGSGFLPGFTPAMVIGFLLLLWVNDTGAYLVGISIGRHRLLERISPKKSWEGFLGGMVLSMVAAWFIAPLLGVTGKTGWLVAALIVSIGGTLGDLVESMLKRSSGVKDSGSVLPGHGGFLDRFDSTVVSFPLVYLWLSFFGG